MKQQKRYYRIWNITDKKYVKLDDGSYAVFEYPIQAENFINKRCKPNKVYDIMRWNK